MTRADTDIYALAFCPADHAEALGGKLYANGAFWNRLNATSAFPWTAPPISLVAVLHIPFHSYHRDHTFAFLLEDADGHRMELRVEGQFRVGAQPDMRHGDPTLMPISVHVGGLSFPKSGDYAFVLEVDGGEIARFPFRVVQVAAPISLPSAPPPDPPPTGGEPPDRQP